MKKLRKPAHAIGIFAALFALLFVFASPVYAAGGLTLSTPFPGTTVTAGKTASFNLSLDNAGVYPLNAEVTIGDMPAGWTAQLTGGGNEVSRVFVRPDGTASMQLALDIPADTSEGEYSVSVIADAGEGVMDVLDLSLNVTATDVTQGLFKSQFPELQGGATTIFTFNADLTNSSAEDRYYSLNADAPEGWQVTFRPAAASADVASMQIAAGESQSVTISVKPPANVTAGEYIIPCMAVSTADSMALELKVIITGTYTLVLATNDGRLNADVQVGRETPVTLVVANTGSADLTNITFSSTLPTTGWNVRFDQQILDILPAGATQEVVAYIIPDSNAVTGDYAASISASTTQASAGIDLRVAVKTSTLWGIIAVIIIALLACGLYLVFKKFGRR